MTELCTISVTLPSSVGGGVVYEISSCVTFSTHLIHYDGDNQQYDRLAKQHQYQRMIKQYIGKNTC